MVKLFHYKLCPLSRSIRLALAEREAEVELVEERAWEWRQGFLALNPAGELPVLEIEPGVVLCGIYSVSEYLGETEPGEPVAGRRRLRLFPGGPEDRAEVRRLVDWFHRKFEREVSRELLAERVYPHLARAAGGRVGGSPDTQRLRALRANLRHHLAYVDFLADQRRCLAGDEPTFADLAAAAHLSVADYLAEIPWGEHQSAKAWYQRIKSRPSFRSLLADRIPGLPPPAHYADLDF